MITFYLEKSKTSKYDKTGTLHQLLTSNACQIYTADTDAIASVV